MERSNDRADDSNTPRPQASFGVMIVSVHVPKCGGISFEHVLGAIYGKKRVWRRYDDAAQLGQAACDRLPEGIRCIHGHFPSRTFDALVPKPELVTWLRHPVERVVSNYHHFLRHPQPDNPCYRQLREGNLGLEQFAELEGMRNEASRYLAGRAPSAFKFIGIMEHYEESLRRFGEVFGVRVPRTPPRENANPDRRTASYSIPARLHARILELNHRDREIYEEARSDFATWLLHSQAADAAEITLARGWSWPSLWAGRRRHAVKFETEPATAR